MEGTASRCNPPSGQKRIEKIRPIVLTGVEFEEELDGVVVQMAAVQYDLDQRREAALAGCRHGHRAGHVQGIEH